MAGTSIAGAITIGRNVGTTPLSAESWRDFIFQVGEIVRATGGTVYAVAKGRGEWDGVAEDNAVITFDDVKHPDLLSAGLAKLAEAFGQDAIALTLGQTTLVGPRTGVAA